MKINFKDKVNLNIGAGGRATQQLVSQLMLKEFDNHYLAEQADQAILPFYSGRLAFTTDSYVVSPLFFNGGDIGSLAVNGTVNDLAVGGATPLYLSAGFIIEEGFSLEQLKSIVESMAKAAKEANVKIVTGDTKVVEKGKGDGIYINTSGVGIITHDNWQATVPQVGDKIIINGSIADHGMAIMSQRNGINFASDIQSDCAPLNDLISTIMPHRAGIRVMRDPTRGGVSATLNEWAEFYGLEINIFEKQLLIRNNVRGLSELLGLDPLNIANEGKVLIICSPDYAEQIIATMTHHEYGLEARIIGEIKSANTIATVNMTTCFGGLRRIDWLSGDQLPRIC